MVRKQELVAQLNDLLGMENKLTHWQFTQIRRYELRETVQRVYGLRQQIDEYGKKLENYEMTFGKSEFRYKDE